MTTLTENELDKLFSGAPQFFARSQGYGSGAPHPSVAFPLNEELTIRDLTDHTQIEHDAWGCVTAIPRLIQRDPQSAVSPTSKARPHFNSRCRERPSMLSMQGLEKGTMGYQAALELSVADSLQEEQYGFDSLGSKSTVIVEQRQRLITSRDALRHMEDATIMEQLMMVETRYHSGSASWRTESRDMYNELFQKVLYPPTKVIDSSDPHSLAVQIHALVKVLAIPNAWIDFSRVEWRMRLGQVLWGFPLDDEIFDGSSINEGADDHDRGEERYWLLLQILLACELLIRLDAITEGEDLITTRLKSSDIHKFEKEANVSVRWSLILARSWLENIAVCKSSAPSEPSGRRSWLATLTDKMSLKHEHMHGAHYIDHTQHRRSTTSDDKYTIKGRYPERQVAGLLQFAQKLRWPGLDLSPAKVYENAMALSGGSPVNTPSPTRGAQRSSYFGSHRTGSPGRKQLVRRRKVKAALHTSGWLSKSYVSGFILPGETLAHFLMSTLLENDKDALSAVGPMADLCSGFVYNGKSFWSTSCVVGRVLAAGRGAAECMGWVSSDVIPHELGDGWINAVVEDIRDDMAKTGKKARIWGKASVERESKILGDADPSDLLPADFIIPHEAAYPDRPPSNIRIGLKSLNVHSRPDSVGTVLPTDKRSSTFSLPIKVPTTPEYSVSVTFTMCHDASKQEMDYNFPLVKDVYFVTAHPCAASNYVKYLKSPSSPTIRQIDVGEHNLTDNLSTSSAQITGHPLHRYYTYTAIHLTDLLSRPESTTLEDLTKDTPTHQRSASTSSHTSSANRPQRVLVIDCITGFAPTRSPEGFSLSRMSSLSSSFALEPQMTTPTQSPNVSSPALERRSSTALSSGRKVERIDPPPPQPPPLLTAESKTHLGTRRRQFGSDLEMLVRAFCAGKGWNAIISRNKRSCLACAIREAGALGWRVVIRVD
ncbi:hypothetical protein GGS20DRAFT_497319 [Poronia punctata]|nr:hypothetical protein GGS20DRAFT_497319 [Poronia punctata]